MLLIGLLVLNGCAENKKVTNNEADSATATPAVEATESEENVDTADDSDTADNSDAAEDSVTDSDPSSLSDTSIAPSSSAGEKFSSHEMKETDWPKGTIDRYIYSDGSDFDHFVVKLDDSEAGYGDALTGEKGVSLFITYDLPSKNGMSATMVGQITLLSSNEYSCAVNSESYSDSEFDALTNATGNELWKKLEYADNSIENGYFKIINDGEIGKGFVEGTAQSSDGSSWPTYSGFVADKAKGQLLKFEISSKDHNAIDTDVLDRLLDSLRIIDADYVEEY